MITGLHSPLSPRSGSAVPTLIHLAGPCCPLSPHLAHFPACPSARLSTPPVAPGVTDCSRVPRYLIHACTTQQRDFSIPRALSSAPWAGFSAAHSRSCHLPIPEGALPPLWASRPTRVGTCQGVTACRWLKIQDFPEGHCAAPGSPRGDTLLQSLDPRMLPVGFRYREEEESRLDPSTG